MKNRIIVVLLCLLFGAWTHGIPVSSVTYNISSFGGICAKNSNDTAAFEAFGVEALDYQSTHPDQLIQLNLDAGPTCGFLGSNLTPSSSWTKGIQKFRINGNGVRLTDSIWLTESVQAKSGTNVLTFVSVPATIVANMRVFDVTNDSYANIPIDTFVVSTTATTVTLSNNLTGNIDVGTEVRFIGSGSFFGSGMPLCPTSAAHGGCDDAFVQTVSAGATSVTVIGSVPTQFAANQWALMSGVDLQGCFSTPVNNFFYEYVYITSIVGNVITFSNPLQYSYESTWPRICPASVSGPEAGGPAVLRYVDPTWDIEQEYRDTQFYFDIAVNAGGRDITCTNCVFGPTTLGSIGGGINPSINKRMVFYNVDASLIRHLEVDKFITELIISGGTYSTILYQSSSPTTGSLTNLTITGQIAGTPKNITISNVTSPELFVGVNNGFGATNSVTVTDSAIPFVSQAISPQSQHVTARQTISSGVIKFWPAVDDAATQAQAVGGAGNLTLNGVYASAGTVTLPVQQDVYVRSSGNDTGITFTIDGEDFYGNVIQDIVQGANGARRFAANQYKIITQIAASGAAAGTVEVGAGGYDPPPAWAAPGQWASLRSQYQNSYVFQVVNLTQDANGMYVETTIAGAGWPTIPMAVDNQVIIAGFPAPEVSFTNVTGTDGANLSRCGSTPIPFWSCQYLIFNQVALATTFSLPDATNVWGNIVSIRVNVTTAYTGSGTFNCFMDPFVFYADGSAVIWNTNTINCKQTGERIITPSGVTCNGSPGGCSGDSITTFGDARISPGQLQLQGSKNIAADCPSLCPVIEFEVRTDPLSNL